MIQIIGVSQDELAHLLFDVEQKGSAIHTSITRVTPASGTIFARPKLGFISVNVRAEYVLKDGMLTVSANTGEGQIHAQLVDDLAAIRASPK